MHPCLALLIVSGLLGSSKSIDQLSDLLLTLGQLALACDATPLCVCSSAVEVLHGLSQPLQLGIFGGND